MSVKTTNYQLTKPEENDYYDVSIPNGNMDVIDAELKKAQNHRENTNNPHQVTAGQAGAIPTTASCNKNWNWSGQGGSPQWVWGGSDPTNEYLYSPANFLVADTVCINSALTLSTAAPSSTLVPGKLWGVY